MQQFKVKGKEYPLTNDIKRQLRKNGISMPLLCGRIAKGWTLYEAVNAPIGTKIRK